MSYLGIFVVLNLLIVVHEAGHLVAAKLAGIPVAGFSVGLGPKLWSRRWMGTEYAFRILPLGGFVLPAGAEDGAFRAVALPKRIAFFLAGPLANLAACVPLFATLNSVRQGISLHGLLVAPIQQLAEMVWRVLVLLPSVFSQPESVSGLVGIVVEGGRLVEAGMAFEVAILLSVSLAALNLLPIPVLDGGQILLGCLEEAWPRMTRLRIPLTVVGLIVLLAVMLYANGRDVARYWG